MENSVVDDDPHQLAAISPDLVIDARGSIDGNGTRDRRERGPAEQRLRSSSRGPPMAGKILEHSAPNPQAAAGLIAASIKRSSNREIRAAQQLCDLSIFLEARNQGPARSLYDYRRFKGNAQLRGEEGEAIDTKPTSGPTPGETEIAAKAYCKDHPSGIINLRSYSGDWYQQSCSELAARLQATTDPSYKTVPD